MSNRRVSAVVLAAGLGTRMKSDHPKVLHPVAGRPLLAHVLDAADAGGADPVVTVTGPEMAAVQDLAAPRPCAVQHERLGTAHAVAAARDALESHGGPGDDVLVLFGDTPLITPATLEAMLAARRGADDPAVVVLGFRPADPGRYGRLVTDAAGRLERIVEVHDATPEETTIELCNGGVMCVDGAVLFDLLDRVDNANAKGEYYLTDLVALARGDGRACAVVEGDATELQGVDSRAGLAAAEAAMQDRLRAAAMAGGATLTAPETVFLARDTVLGRDTIVEPHVVFGPGVTVADGATVHAFSHLEGAHVESGAAVGPYARLRPGTRVERDARVGNFVETKKATIEAGAKVPHLTYAGDATVGEKANVGAGTITCNYDGFNKGTTRIGAGAFIGSNTALVAPVSVGDAAVVGAGSTITSDVPADALAVARGRQETREGGAARLRARKQAERDKE